MARVETENLQGPENLPSEAKDSGDSTSQDTETVDHLVGWRLHGTAFTSQLCIFMANLEVSIVSTSLIDIADSLKSFNQSSWIISSYLITYTGFLMIWAKLSDSLGRRQCLCASIILFTAASGACGAAQSITQLIIFRAFQGIGGSGLISLNFVILPEMVQAEKYALYAAFTSCAFVVGFLLGPILGGAIVDSTTWRWVFLINVPLGVVSLVLVLGFLPVGFPDLKAHSGRLNLSRLGEIDVLGSCLISGACALIVAALEEAGTDYRWDSPTIITLIFISGAMVLAFPFYEWSLALWSTQVQPIFPKQLFQNRVFMGSILICFCAGVNFTVSVIQIPQEWQTVFATTAMDGGIRLLPFTICYSLGTVVAMVLTSKLQVPPLFVVVMGGLLQATSTSVMSFVPIRGVASKYVCECLFGIGTGENVGVMVQMTPQLVRGKDQATAMGAITQARALGGVVGFALTWNVFNGFIKNQLDDLLSSMQLQLLLETPVQGITSLSPDLRSAVTGVFARAYDLEIMILVGMSSAQILGAALLWENQFRRLI